MALTVAMVVMYFVLLTNFFKVVKHYTSGATANQVKFVASILGFIIAWMLAIAAISWAADFGEYIGRCFWK